ncbi:putative protein ABIL5 isoform X2 [Carex rostrata]
METSENEKPEAKAKAGAISVAPVSRCSSFLCSEATTEAEQFEGSLRELKDLRSQLHQAADYCEDAFLKEEKKKMILDSTKSYICDAIVAVIDHLGTVSSKLELELCNISKASQTEQQMDLLNQRLLMCQQFTVTAELATIQYREKLPQHHHRYVSDGQILKQYDSRSREEGGCQKLMDSHREEKLALSGRFQRTECGKEQLMILTPSTRLKDSHKFGGDDKKKVQQGSNFLAFLSKNRKKSQFLKRRVG